MSNHDDDKLAQWIRQASPIAKPSATRRAQAFDAVHQEWRAALEAKTPDISSDSSSGIAPTPRARWWPAALAAGIVLAISVLTPLAINGPVITQVAAVQGTGGLIHAASGPKAWFGISRPLVDGETIREGEWLETAGDSPIRFSLGNDLSVRIAGNTRLTLASIEHFELEQGAVYIESTAMRADQSTPLAINTPFGSVTHVGTRYLVKLSDTQLQVMVREGLVRLDSKKGGSQWADAGTALMLSPSDLQPTVSTVAAYDAAFDWLADIPRPLDASPLTLSQFFEWYQVETGKKIVMDMAEHPEEMTNIIVTGDVTRLAPEAALDAVALSGELQITRQADRTVVYPVTR